jgi:hypothetical protein
MVMIRFSFGTASLQNPGHRVNILDIFETKVPTGLCATYHGIKEI